MTGVVVKRELGLFDCFCMVTGVIIGAGIFVAPKGILQYTRSVGWSMVVWIFCGVISCFGALSFAELGTSIPLSGGDITFLHFSVGSFFAFLRVWTLIVAVRTGIWSLSSILIGTYVSGAWGSCVQSPLATNLLAASVLILVMYINCWSVTLSRKFQNVFTVAKVAGLTIIIIAGAVQGDTSNFRSSFQSFDSEPISVDYFPLAVFSGLFAFSGWQVLPQITEEIVNPGRTMPIAIILSMVFVTAIYLLVNIAYLLVLSPTEMLESDAVAMQTRIHWGKWTDYLSLLKESFGEKVLGVWWWTMPLSVCLSCLGSLNGGVFGGFRLFHVASRYGYLPSFVAMLHVTKKTPLPSAIVTLPVSLVLLTFGDVYKLINYLSFSRWLFLGLTAASIPYYRKKYAGIKRPFTFTYEPLSTHLIKCQQTCILFQMWSNLFLSSFVVLFSYVFPICDMILSVLHATLENPPLRALPVPLFVPIVFTLSCIFMVVMSIHSAPMESLIGLGITLAGIPFYVIGVLWERKPPWFNKHMRSFTVFSQKLFLIVPEERDAFYEDVDRQVVEEETTSEETTGLETGFLDGNDSKENLIR